MEITKKDFEDISTIIFDSFLTKDVFLLDTYFTIRNVSRYESDEISQKYKYKEGSNFYIMLDVLSLAIIKIGGLEIKDHNVVRNKLKNSNAMIVSFFYGEYIKLVKRINNFSDIMEIYIETDESTNNWSIFKNFSNHYDFSNLKTINGFQKNWILLNLEKDRVETQKGHWGRASYMTNAICAFTNGKQYKQNKNALNAMSQFEMYDRDAEENKRIAEDISLFSEVDDEKTKLSRKGKQHTNKDNELFGDLKQRRDETKEECIKRIDKALEKRANHEVIDDHDRIVKEEGIKKLSVIIYDYRKKHEIANKIIKMKREIEGEEDIEVLGEVVGEEKIKGEFYHNNVIYDDIMNTKGLHFVTKEEKRELFDAIMKIKFDVDKEADAYIRKVQEDKFKLNEQNKDLDSMGFMPLKKE